MSESRDPAVVTRNGEEPRNSSGLRLLSSFSLASLALIVALFALFLPWRSTSTGSVSKTGTVDGGSGNAVAAKADAQEVSLGDLFVRPKMLSIIAGDHVSLVVRNIGKIPHDLRFASGLKTKLLKPGQVQTLDIGVVNTSLEAWCTVSGHKEAGMVLRLNVNGGSNSDGVTAAVGNASNAQLGTESGSANGASANATIDFSLAPPTGWKPRDPVMVPPAAGSVHEVTFHATETVLEVAPGVTQ